jgi:hypothetical protein
VAFLLDILSNSASWPTTLFANLHLMPAGRRVEDNQELNPNESVPLGSKIKTRA